VPGRPEPRCIVERTRPDRITHPAPARRSTSRIPGNPSYARSAAIGEALEGRGSTPLSLNAVCETTTPIEKALLVSRWQSRQWHA